MITKQKPLAVSIIIPVYNEENYLSACLDSIEAQTERPREVIVVDNNSTDDSVTIARSYSFVTVLHESRQHQSFAQKTGFAHASGDIIGRIDADTILPVDWCEKIAATFKADSDLVGVSGSAVPYDMILAGLNKFAFEQFITIARVIAGHKLMWGANCAFKRSAYETAKDRLSDRQDIWEDFDLSFCLHSLGRIETLSTIDVSVSFRAVHKPLAEILAYQYRAVRTIRLHKNRFITSLFFVSWFSLFVAYPFVLLDRFVLQPMNASSASVLGRKRKTDTTNSSIR